MRLAAISDIHGNLPALEAVLADIARSAVDATVNLGDILSGPLWIAETADRLMALGLPTITGNHERQLLQQTPAQMNASDAFAAARLDDRHRAWLAALPATLRFADDVLLCHGTPQDDLRYLQETLVPWGPGLRAATVDEVNERLAGAMDGVPNGLVLCGHSHQPRITQLPDGRLAVNPGSVGLQATDDVHPVVHQVENGSPHARYAVLTRRAHGWRVELRCVPYDHEAAAKRADANDRPDWAHALRTGFVLPRMA